MHKNGFQYDKIDIFIQYRIYFDHTHFSPLLFLFYSLSCLSFRIFIFPIISLLLQKKLHKFELACLANLCPETAEESKALIPRLVPDGTSFVCDV